MAECRNQECRNGYTPGIVTVGKGTANVPVLGAVMRWGWVKCRACNPSQTDTERGVVYQHVSRTPQEVAERARLADSKASYDAKTAAKRTALEKVAAGTSAPASSGVNQVNSGMVEKLMGQIEKLTDQVTKLLEENRALHARLDSGANGALPEERQGRRTSRKSTKKEGEINAPTARPKNKRALS